VPHAQLLPDRITLITVIPEVNTAYSSSAADYNTTDQHNCSAGPPIDFVHKYLQHTSFLFLPPSTQLVLQHGSRSVGKHSTRKGSMQGAPAPPDRNSLILALARDNRAEDLQKAIAAGIPVSYANRVRDDALLQATP
jgi:hypothetical protein